MDQDLRELAEYPEANGVTLRRLANYAKAGQTHRAAELIRGTSRCPGCGVPLIVSAHGDVGDDSTLATELRLAAGQIVGDEGMENWLDCGECQ